MVVRCGMYLLPSEMVGYCEQGIGHLRPIKGGKYLD